MADEILRDLTVVDAAVILLVHNRGGCGRLADLAAPGVEFFNALFELFFPFLVAQIIPIFASVLLCHIQSPFNSVKLILAGLFAAALSFRIIDSYIIN